ncbi:MAG: HAD hydrolase family protein [Elusimicrobia bacterium]|nr:HAD hydrolase family protein [Elusimicrobiota bacterium]
MKIFSAALAAALVIVSPGFEAHRAFAQMVEAPVAPRVLTAPVSVGAVLGVQPAMPVGGVQLALPTIAVTPVTTVAKPVLLARSVASASALAAAPIAARTTQISKLANAAGPVNQAGGESAQGFGASVFNALLGLDARGLASAALPAAEEVPARPSGLTRSVPAPGVEAQEYQAARKELSAISSAFGLAFSLPVAGPKLAASLLEEAATKKVVFSDFDDTLDKFNSQASPETVAAIVRVLKAGKTVVVITDRPDEKKPGAKGMTILESLESIPAADRAGLYVASNKGARVLRYGADGNASLVAEEEGISGNNAVKMAEAVAEVKKALASLKAEQHDGSQGIDAESMGKYGYAMMLKIGSKEEAVRAVADAFQKEMARLGLPYEAEPRFAKNPANPPYISITFAKIDKSVAVKRVSGLLGIGASEAVVVGDSMFAPKNRDTGKPAAEVAEAKARGEALSGQPVQTIGNGTDRDMEKGLPGALTLSVGATADPAMSNAFVMPGKGPDVTRRILDAVASRSVKPAPEVSTDIPAKFGIPLAIALIGAAAASYWALFSAIEAVISSGWQQMVPHAPWGWEGLFPMGMSLVLGSLMVVNRDLPDPNEMYAQALKAARERSGVADLRVLHVNGSLPVQDQMVWSFTFALPGGDGKFADQVVVDIDRGMFSDRGPYGTRAMLYRNAPVTEEAIPFSSDPYLFSRGVKVTPAAALTEAVRRAGYAPGGWSVQLRVGEEAESGDKDFWYHFYGADRHVAINARTGEFRGVQMPSKIQDDGTGWWPRLKKAVGDWAHPKLANWMGRPQAEPSVTDEQVRAAARSTVSQKGGIWSATEYNMAYYFGEQHLREKGATEAQLALYKKLCDEAPVINGRFNPWSGD